MKLAFILIIGGIVGVVVASVLESRVPRKQNQKNLIKKGEKDQPRELPAEISGTLFRTLDDNLKNDREEEAEYNEWLAGKKAEAAEYASTIGKEWSFDELMVRGEDVYNRSCAACHQADGNGIPGVFPALKDSPIALGAKEGHIAVLIDGVAGTSMQSFADQLSEVDIAAVVHYERNAWGNDVGDVTQPIDVLNYKQGQ